ncbi:dead end protein 1 [Episyrphus balteatus]|uniref:dead end protein 1 n=1 Tax=Episyrphus balteatus TaxID=286459 RepID=UPI002486791C|nr:dead end protein 1 [Episyrphus balteatus]
MPFLELINGVPYEFYQINGSKYYKNYNECPPQLKNKLEQCAGEIFISAIPEHTTADQMAAVACLLGEMYILRFKVNFAGLSRGFAYLQYMDPNLMNYAIDTLPHLFAANRLGDIRVHRSRNTSNLVLRNVTDMNPDEVRITLAEMCKYRECNLRFLRDKDNTIEYQLVFGSNEDAVKARRLLLGEVDIFGTSATIGWDNYHGTYGSF